MELASAIFGPPAPLHARQTTAQQQREDNIGLPDAIAIAVTRHPDIARALAAQARGRADLGSARSVWMPSVSYSANIGPNMFDSYNNSSLNNNMQGPSIALNQLVWDFGRAQSDIQAASAVERQRHFELSATADQIAEKTALAYLDITRADMMHRESERQLKELERLRDLIRMRAKAGISDQSDLVLAEVRIEGARADVIQADANLTASKAELVNLIGIMPTGYDNPAPIFEQFQDDMGEPDFDSLPIVASANENKEASSARINFARAERYPRLGLQLGYSHNNYSYESRDNALTAVITVKGDLYQAGTTHRVEAAQQDRHAARAEKEAIILNIKGQIHMAREAIRGGVSRIGIYQNQEEKAVAARDIFIEEYKLGKRSLFDLLNAEQEIYRAASARVMAQIDVMRARVELYSAYGLLRTTLGIVDTLAKADRHE